jgi:hypothetical protein
MRIRTPLAGSAAAVLLFATACNLEDNSSQVTVEVTADAPVVVRGDKIGLHARAIRVDGTDTIEIKNIRFSWLSSDRAIATVEGDDFGGAEVTGVNGGLVEVTATAVAFEQSQSGIMPIRVANFLEIDSIKPDSVKWGAKATIYGVGVRNIAASLPGSGLAPDTFSFVGSPLGLGQMSFWVPPPARSGRIFAVGLGVFLNATDSTKVDTLDLYEIVGPNTINDTSPALINLDGAPPFPPVPTVLFFNPALSFEALPRDSSGSVAGQRFDWYRFARVDTTQPFTVVIKPQSLVDSTGLFIVVSDSLLWLPGGFHAPGNFLDPTVDTWFTTSANFYVCPKGGFSPDMERSDSLILQFKRRTGYGGNRGVHLLAFYSQPQAYSLAVASQFSPTDPRIAPDRFEENDICTFADSTQKVPATRIEVSTTGPQQFVPFTDSTLTIDTPHDVDFYRFRVTAAVSESVMIKVRSRPFGTGPLVFDRSDIDLYVMRINPGDSTFSSVGSVSSIGSRDSLRLFLAPGDYYLAVADFAGEVTRYSLCIQVRVTCTPPVAAVEAAGALAQARARDRGRDDGRTKTGSMRHRDWAVSGGAARDARSPFRRP